MKAPSSPHIEVSQNPHESFTTNSIVSQKSLCLEQKIERLLTNKRQMRNLEEKERSSSKNKMKGNGRWSKEENNRFIEGIHTTNFSFETLW